MASEVSEALDLPASAVEQPDSYSTPKKTRPQSAVHSPVSAGSLAQAAVGSPASSTGTPGRSPRPVCYSLHKFFQTSSPVARSPIAEQALVEQPGKQNWQLKEQQAVAQQTAAHQQLVLVEAVSSADAQAVVPQIKQAFRGGRPKKAPGAAKGRYVSQTAFEKHLICQNIAAYLREPGHSKMKAFDREAKRLGCVPATVEKWWGHREVWSEWVQRHPGSKKTFRIAGSRRVLSKLQSRSLGKRSAGSRGYLGRTDHCRQLVEAVKVWAESETDQGHGLLRSHLLSEFEDRLAVAISDALAEQAAGTLLPEQEPYLQAWQQKQAALAIGKKRDKYSRFLVVKTAFVELKKQRVTSLPKALETERLLKSWRVFDRN